MKRVALFVLFVLSCASIASSTQLVDTDSVQTLSNKTLNGTNTIFTNGTLTLGGNFTISGAFATTLTVTGTTTLTLPTTGTLATLAGSETFTTKTFSLGSNTLTGTTAQFNTALSDNDFATLAGAESLSNKTIPSPVLSGTVTGTYGLAGTPTITAPIFSGTATGTYTLGGTPTGSLLQVLATGSTTPRTLAVRSAEALNVKDSGAVGDGVANDTAAFTSAATASTDAQPFVPRGTYLLSTSPTATGTPTWIIDTGAAFTGAGVLPGRIFRRGNGGVYGHATKIGSPTAWLEAERMSTENNADLVVLSHIGQGAILGGSRTSDFATPGSQGSIGILGFALNNNASQVQSAYAGYFEARRKAGAGITHGNETDIVNEGSVIKLSTNAMGATGLTAAFWAASGGGVVGANSASLAFGILANTQTFQNGIMFQNGSLESIGGERQAINFPPTYGLIWEDASGGIVARLRSDATAASLGIVFGDGSFNLQTIGGANLVTVDTSGNTHIGGALKVDASLSTSLPRTNTAATDTIGATDNYMINNYGAGSCTVILPSASTYPGRRLVIRSIVARTTISDASNVIPLAGGAAGTAILAATAGKWAELVSDGTNWQIMAGN